MLDNDAINVGQLDDAIANLSTVYMPIDETLAEIAVNNPSDILLGSNYITSTAAIIDGDQYITSDQTN